jgi:hypothetical protein
MNQFRLLLAMLALVAAAGSQASPDRDGLIDAWEAHVASLPATAEFERLDDGRYRLVDEDLPYSGELTIVGALVRPLDTAPYDDRISHTGMVEFRLDDLPDERRASQSYYFWLEGRQTLFYSQLEDRWVDMAGYQAAYASDYDDVGLGPLSFMLNWGIWILLIGFFVFVFIAVGRQGRKAKTLMDQTAAINEKANANLDRSDKMQDEVLAIAREARDLHAEGNALLKEMLETLRASR